MTVRFFFSIGTGIIPLHTLMVSARCAGVVPQQPPIIHAPSITISSISFANSSGFTSYTVCPFTFLGRPAFGFTIIGVEQQAVSSFINAFICVGPSPQLKPIPSTPSPSSNATAAGISPPVSSFACSSKVMVTNTGNFVFSFTASTAAFTSCVSLMVSIRATSAPACSPTIAISLNASYAPSNSKSPNGRSSLPVGPISIATSP